MGNFGTKQLNKQMVFMKILIVYNEIKDNGLLNTEDGYLFSYVLIEFPLFVLWLPVCRAMSRP